MELLFPDENPWTKVRDGNDRARAIFDRHYSRIVYKDGRKPKLFVGPGEKIVLLSTCNKAIFVWRKFISDDGQQGVNCAVFRNESNHKASKLILLAEQIAWKRWPGERLYTYVNQKKIRAKQNPGHCFIIAGWRPCGITKSRKLIILEKLP